jgi:hypothetical protein
MSDSYRDQILHQRQPGVRIWCEHNKNRFYIPEWLLKEWRITVDPHFSDAAYGL